ncbi:MAG: ABC transporter substrate-binding protein [Betaproteobacteria bacterium]|nr:ABC transporter substrate-binding protein [Betaproteobacteria bacterium]MBI2961572.1 ABC transporter substrate-binding protein [Betaproteobacteria bacterium]
MLNFKSLVTLVAIAMTAALPRHAAAKDTIKFANQQDPVFIAAVYPIQSGKVKSDLVTIEFSFLGIAGLNQAPATRQYDVVHTASISVPRARDQGIPMNIIAISNRYPRDGDGANIWVKESSPYRTLADLKGRTIGTYGLNSGGFTNVRQVLALKLGFNVDLDKGDFRFVELPAPALPAALESGRIDAATLVHAQIFKAKQSGGFRSLVKVQEEGYKLFGVQVPSLVLAAYTERLNAKPAAYRAFLKLLQDSMAYVRANPGEVFKAVGAQQNIDPAYFTMWFKEFGDIPYALGPNDIVGLRKSWEASKKIGALDRVPEVTEVIWSGAIQK